MSKATGALTLTVARPVDGDKATGYEVRCTKLLTSVTRVYPKSGATRTGFDSGRNTCRVRALNSAGASRWVAVNTTVL